MAEKTSSGTTATSTSVIRCDRSVMFTASIGPYWSTAMCTGTTPWSTASRARAAAPAPPMASRSIPRAPAWWYGCRADARIPRWRARPRSAPQPTAQAVPPVLHAIAKAAVLAAAFRLGAHEKHLLARAGAEAVGRLAVREVDLDERDARRHTEAAARGDAVERGPHELRPERQGALGPAQAMRLAAVEADPHRHEQPRSAADKPRIAPLVRRPRLTRHRARHAECARRRARPGVDHAFEQRGHEVRLRRRHGGLRCLVVGLDRAAPIVEFAHGVRGRRALAAVEERQVGAGQLERRDLERAERHRGHGIETTLDPERARPLDDGRQPDVLREPHGGRVERLLQRLPHGHTAEIAVLVIPR